MKYYISILFLTASFLFSGCKETTAKRQDTIIAENTINYAKGLEIYRYQGYSIVKVTNPWPGAGKAFTYVMHQQDAVVPDSLSSYTAIQVPLKTVVVTSTTHIPSLEMLGVENTLIGFPGTDYISSEKTRALIDSGKVRETGSNESLNTEVMIDLSPDAVVGFSISNDNKTLNNLEKSGLKVLYNGDWNEQTPLGRAEWIKFFGALYGLEDKADEIFEKIKNDYNEVAALAQKTGKKPTILCGAIYQDKWYLPQGSSWAALFLKDAGADYLWKDTEGTGSLSLSLETVLDKAENVDYWIGPSQYTSLAEMEAANPHYKRFKAFRNGEVYSFSTKKGSTGGLIYYELAQNRPDIVIKDLIKILHPDLLPQHELYFFEKLK